MDLVCHNAYRALYTRNARNEGTIVPIEQSVISRHVTLGYVRVALIHLKFTEILSPLTRSDCYFVRSSVSFVHLLGSRKGASISR